MQINEYQKKMFKNILEKCVLNKWYDIDPKRADYNEFVEAVKLFIDVWGLAEFRDETYTKFRRIERFNNLELYMEKNNITFGKSLDVVTNFRYSEVPKVEKVFRGSPSAKCSSPEIVKRILERVKNVDQESIYRKRKEEERLNKLKKWKSEN